MKSKAWRGKDGAALLMAMVMMMMLTVLGLSLVTASYHLFGTVNRRGASEQCRELAQGFSRILELEIAGVRLETLKEQETAREQGSCALWFYLREQAGQEGWPCHAENQAGHGKEDAGVVRKFQLALPQETGAEMEVAFWWEQTQEAEEIPEMTLFAEVTCRMEHQQDSVTSAFVRSVSETGIWQWDLEERK